MNRNTVHRVEFENTTEAEKERVRMLAEAAKERIRKIAEANREARQPKIGARDPWHRPLSEQRTTSPGLLTSSWNRLKKGSGIVWDKLKRGMENYHPVSTIGGPGGFVETQILAKTPEGRKQLKNLAITASTLTAGEIAAAAKAGALGVGLAVGGTRAAVGGVTGESFGEALKNGVIDGTTASAVEVLTPLLLNKLFKPEKLFESGARRVTRGLIRLADAVLLSETSDDDHETQQASKPGDTESWSWEKYRWNPEAKGGQKIDPKNIKGTGIAFDSKKNRLTVPKGREKDFEAYMDKLASPPKTVVLDNGQEVPVKSFLVPRDWRTNTEYDKDYDYVAAFLDGVKPSPVDHGKDGWFLHMNDIGKMPTHPTFSKDSYYARDPKYAPLAGEWKGETYLPGEAERSVRQATDAGDTKPLLKGYHGTRVNLSSKLTDDDERFIKRDKNGNATAIYGYPIRGLYPGEEKFFSTNKNVAGMATEDGAVILNPYSDIPGTNYMAVAKLEAARHGMKQMRADGVYPRFSLTPAQEKYFSTLQDGKPYGSADDISDTILSRIIVGDSSAQDATEEQAKAAMSVLDYMRSRDNRETRQAADAGDTEGPEVPVEEPVPQATEPVPEGGPRIIVNPAVFEDKRDALCVAMNEAFRVLMEVNGFNPVSEPTDAQRRFFSDTAYSRDENQMRRTILARICTFDTSVKDPTNEQIAESVEFLEAVMEMGAPQNEWEQQAVQRIHDVLRAALEAGVQPGEAPVEEAPVEEAPVEEAPVEEAPVEEAPVEEAPVEEAPVEEAPVEEAPVEEAPVGS